MQKVQFRFYFFLVFVIIFFAGPFLWQIITSLKPASELATLPPILPSNPTFENYAYVFEERPFLRIVLNSFIVATSTTFLSLGIGSLAAFALAKLEMKGKSVVLLIILSASMFPSISIVAPLFVLVRALHLRDTLFALIFTYTVFALPFTIWVLTNFFKSIPNEIYLASRVDGCTIFQSFYRIVLPLSAPGLFSTAILVFIFSWNEFLFALVFTATVASRTAPVEIALFPGIHEVPWGEMAAASVVVTIPVVVLVFLFRQIIIEGIIMGAIKG
jgi:multiple sugar transport system permease protein